MSSLNTIIFTALSLGGTWFFVSRSRPGGDKGLTNFITTATVVLHSLHILYNLALLRPPNLFTRLGIPINAPVDRIRSLLIKEAGLNGMAEGRQGAIILPPEIPKEIELLLTRLGIRDNRGIYVRFGQRVMQTCLYCSSTTDYTILTLSGVLLEYLRTATLLLLLTANINGRQRLRTNVLGALVCAFFAEVYAFTSASAVPLEKDAEIAFMWHDILFFARNALLLLLPLISQFLPAIYPPPPASMSLASALGRLERTLPRAHLLKYLRQAVLRHPDTRERAVAFWTDDAAEGETARSDPNVQLTASKLGLGFAKSAGSGENGGQDVSLRVNARMAVRSLQPLFVPPSS